MKFKNPTTLIYYLCALAFYTVAVIKFMSDDHSHGITWICTGTTFFCLGTIMARRNSKKDDNEDSHDGFDK